jgi:hypothetical protein
MIIGTVRTRDSQNLLRNIASVLVVAEMSLMFAVNGGAFVQGRIRDRVGRRERMYARGARVLPPFDHRLSPLRSTGILLTRSRL